jgi:hypothetical protein
MALTQEVLEWRCQMQLSHTNKAELSPSDLVSVLRQGICEEYDGASPLLLLVHPFQSWQVVC